MLSTESFLELLRLLPDDKRNKLLSNSKLKQYSIDGYRNLKYAPLKVLSAHAVKSHLFCETFLSLVVDEYNCLTPKDAQTFSIGNRQISRRMDTHGIIVVERFATFHYY